MGIKIISESAVEPILVDEAGFNLRAQDDGNSPPTYIEASRITKLIKDARELCEEELELSLIEKTIELALDRFPCDEIELLRPPVRSITSVKYIDEDGVEQTLGANLYVLDNQEERKIAWLLPAVDTSWPTTKAVVNAVKVRYVSGYRLSDSPPDVVPEPLRQAMHLMIAHAFANREAVDVGSLAEMPMGVHYRLGKYRIGLGV